MSHENRSVRILLVGLVVSVVLGLVGCRKKQAGASGADGAKPDSARNMASDENPAAIPRASPPQPQGPQVGTQRSTLELVPDTFGGMGLDVGTSTRWLLARLPVAGASRALVTRRREPSLGLHGGR